MASLQSTDDLMKEVELPFDRGDWIGRNALGKNESGTTEPVKLPLNQKYHNAANTVFERLVLPSRNKSLRDDIANNVKIQAHGIDYVRSIDCGSELSHFAVSPTYAHSALYTTNKIMDATKETAEIKELLLPDNSPLTTDFISGRIFGDALDERPVPQKAY
ncbi:PREDICTED: uncharacterized protein LOC105449859 isoform X2 [Wasmannia auropunctata]|uniref:uncharacterized protein LOC105449859 isoform X2 n=1 Tax=Wasmannia auropunctata TaxID=64793 RepID=UPI0005EDB22C|nr:PREDICTED: uncharacterized protein LOC105449859 isoform X2 [Wasmannia auropunctata]